MFLLANHPWFISSTKRTGFLEQCESSFKGFMSAKLTMLPSSDTKAAVRGNSVLRIQKHCMAGCSKTNSMPSFWGISLRHMSPICRCSKSCANCTWIKCMPAFNVARCSWVCGMPWAPALRVKNEDKRQPVMHAQTLLFEGRWNWKMWFIGVTQAAEDWRDCDSFCPRMI